MNQRAKFLVLIGIAVYLWVNQGGPIISSTAPINAPGYVGVLIHHPADKLTSDQQVAIASFTNYLEDAGGEGYIIPPEATGTEWPAFTPDLLARPRTSRPWVVLSNQPKGVGVEQPLPATDTELKALIAKYQ